MCLRFSGVKMHVIFGYVHLIRVAGGYSMVVAVAGGRVRARVCLPRVVKFHFTKASIILEFCFVLFYGIFLSEFTMF